MTEYLTLTPAEVERRNSDLSAACEIISDEIRCGRQSLDSACELLDYDPVVIRRHMDHSPRCKSLIAAARATYIAQLVGVASECQTKWGTPDPQVAMFMLERCSPERFGPIAKAPAGGGNVSITIDLGSLHRLQELQRARSAPAIEQTAPIDGQITIVPQA